MSNRKRILWTEGLFLCPQTFQQHDNFLLDDIESRCRPVEPHFWGITEFSIQQSKLDNGIFSLTICRGIFPDGTVFDISGSILEVNITEADKNKKIYLAIGARQEGVHETVVSSKKDDNKTVRYILDEMEVVDTHTIGSPAKSESMQVGNLNFQLIASDKPQNNFTQIPLAYIADCNKNGLLKLSNTFIPPTLYTHASPIIKNYIVMILGQLTSRGEILSNRLANPNTGEINDIIDIHMLQIINRHIPLFDFLSVEERMHPRQLYLFALQLVGELSTFARKERRPLSYTEYIHDDLQLTFCKLFDDIHEYLQYSTVPKALSIPLKQTEYKTVYESHHLMESVFIDHVRFVLSVRGDLSLGELQNLIPKIVTLASNQEHLSQQVRTHTPGVSFKALPSVPREIPYHDNCVYFDLDINNHHWQKVVSNRVMNLHVDHHSISNLKFEVWAIRGNNNA